MNAVRTEDGLPDLVPHPESDAIDGITYDKYGRMEYHPDFHPNHRKHFTEDELEYLCAFWGIDNRRSMAYALGRTEFTVTSKYCELKKKGLADYYKTQYLQKLSSL